MRRVRIVLIFLTVSCLPVIALATTDGTPATSVEDKLAQLVMLEVYPGGNESHFAIVESQVRKFKPGGIIAKNGTPQQVAWLVDRLNRALEMPLLVAGSLQNSGYSLPVDQVMRAITDLDLIRETGVLIGTRLRKAGVDMVIDPSLNMSGSEFDQYGNLLSHGYYTEGIIPVYSPNSMSGSFDAPGAIILPYEAPAALKKKFDYSNVNVRKLREAGLDQLILVQAPQDIGLHPDWILHALTAGADLVITNAAPGSQISNLRKWLRTGKISEREINKKYQRVVERKFSTQQPYSEQVKYIDSSRDAYVFDRLMSSSVALVRDRSQILPFGHLDTLQIALLVNEQTAVLEEFLDKYTYIHKLNALPASISGFDFLVAPLLPGASEKQLAELRALKNRTHVVIVALGWDDISSLQSFEQVIVAPEDHHAVQAMVPQVLFGAVSPAGRWTGKLPQGFSEKLEIQTMNRLSYSHPFAAEMDPETLEKIDGIAIEAIEKGATPGMQVIIGRAGKVVFEKSYGYYSYDQEKPVTDQTIYDLASVTKVLATLQAVMFMEERRLIDIDKPLSDYLPELKGSNKEDLIIRDILLHQAGLRSWLPFWKETMNDEELSREYYNPYPEEEYPLQVSNGLFASGAIRDSVWHWIIDSRLLRKPKGENYSYRYSDMGFYMMHRLAEKVLNQPLNDFVQQNFYDPLGMVTTTYLPLCKFEIDDIAPTANDAYFRKQLIAGLVHDEGAAMFGGVAGHSGLFSNGNDLAKILQMLLWQGSYGGIDFLNKETIEMFSSKQVRENRRGLGWDKPNVGHWKSPTSEYASARTFGHTGFTGTAVWIDPEFDMFYIFLSNRINPDAENTKLMKLNVRSRIQDLIYKSIFELEQFNERLLTPEP